MPNIRLTLRVEVFSSFRFGILLNRMKKTNEQQQQKMKNEKRNVLFSLRLWKTHQIRLRCTLTFCKHQLSALPHMWVRIHVYSLFVAFFFFIRNLISVGKNLSNFLLNFRKVGFKVCDSVRDFNFSCMRICMAQQH